MRAEFWVFRMSVVRVLALLRPLSRGWVLPSPKSEISHITLTERLKYNPHKHRRTFATVAMGAGVFGEVVGRLINHTPLLITGQRYPRPSQEPLRPSIKVAREEILKCIDNETKG